MSLMVVRKSDASKFTTGFTTTTDCGGISAGTSIGANISIQKVVEDMVYSNIDPTDPNTRYESKDLGTWSTASQVDTFLSTYNHANNYTGLSLGNYVTIQDGTYNVDWLIVGFDCEYNRTASDGTVYNNGYGILMIPRINEPGTAPWHSSYNKAVSYINSDIHTSTLPSITTRMKNILGSHLIQRNVLLGNKNTGTNPRSWSTNGYTWTTSDLTLMSVGQITGTFKGHNNKYDDGEANYKLPLLNYTSLVNGFYTRCVYGSYNSSLYIWRIKSGGIPDKFYASSDMSVRPLMLLR